MSQVNAGDVGECRLRDQPRKGFSEPLRAREPPCWNAFRRPGARSLVSRASLKPRILSNGR